MICLGVILAEDPILLRGFSMPVWLSQALIIFGTLILVTGLLVLWAVFIRKKPRQRRRHHHVRPVMNVASAPAETEPPAERQRSRHRRRHSNHPPRPLNPTLAESRGLPPIRNRNTPPAGL